VIGVPATARSSIRGALALLLLLSGLSIALSACGGGDSNSNDTRTVETTKVKVVEGSGEKGTFDASAIYKRLSNGVVTVISLFGKTNDLESLLGGNGSAGQGSGFVLDDHGYIATNAHVITEGRGKGIKKAREVYVQFGDGNQVSAKIVGYDPNSDVGLIKVDPSGLELVPLKLGRSSAAEVGEPVLAIGSPFGEEQSLSVGVISATDRTIEALTDFQIGNAIQTDAAINHGNSGGPLLNSQGEVIGINSQIRSAGGGSEGVGFAVPSDTVRHSIGQLRSSGTVRYAYLGVSSQALYPQLAKRLDLPVKEGALVVEVVKGGPADKAGIKGGGKEIRFQTTLVKLGGDVITKVNGQAVTARHDISELISRLQPGDTISLEVYRGGDRRTVQVKLGERPADLPK
jgi:S1-C subfamily serine protease